MRTVVLGGGPGGYVAAIRAAQLGAKVTLVEKEKVGGTCLHWGCIPTKVLKATADIMDLLGRAKEMGVELGGRPAVDLESLMERKRKVVETQEKGILKLLERFRIRLVQGLGHRILPGALKVRLSSGGEDDLPWERLILAVGSKPMSLPSLPFDGRYILSSSDILELKKLPASVLIVGGGVVGCELATILRSLGSKVSIVEAMDRLLPLPSLDPDMSAVLEREMRKRGIEIYVRKVVERVEEREGRVEVTLGTFHQGESGSLPPSGPKSIVCDRVIVCVGREPTTKDMDLEPLGLRLRDKGWIEANEELETNVQGVFAVGDALGPSRPMLAHLASAEGIVAAENSLGEKRKMSYEAVPSAIFTTPEVSSVGLSETEAGRRGLSPRSETFLFRLVGKAHATGDLAGHVKVVFDGTTRRILGFQIVGGHATELIWGCGALLNEKATLEDLAHTIFPHPTFSEAIGELAHKALGRPIHG